MAAASTLQSTLQGTESKYLQNDDKIMKLAWQRIMVYKSVNGLAPEYLRTKFTDRSVVSSYTIRDCEAKLAIPLLRTNFLKKQFQLQWCGAVEQPTCQVAATETVSSFNSGCSGFFDNNG